MQQQTTPPPAYGYDQKNYTAFPENGQQPPQQASYGVQQNVVVCQPVACGGPNSGPACFENYNRMASRIIGCGYYLVMLLIGPAVIGGYALQTAQYQIGIHVGIHCFICGTCGIISSLNKRHSTIMPFFIFSCIALGVTIGLLIHVIFVIKELNDFNEVQNAFRGDEKEPYDGDKADISNILNYVCIGGIALEAILFPCVIAITIQSVKKICNMWCTKRSLRGNVIQGPTAATAGQYPATAYPVGMAPAQYPATPAGTQYPPAYPVGQAQPPPAYGQTQ